MNLKEFVNLFKLCPWVQACELLLTSSKEVSIKLFLLSCHPLLHPAEHILWTKEKEIRLLPLIVGLLACSESGIEGSVPRVDNHHPHPVLLHLGPHPLAER